MPKNIFEQEPAPVHDLYMPFGGGVTMSDVTPGVWYKESEPDTWRIEVFKVRKSTSGTICYDFAWLTFDGTPEPFKLRRSPWYPPSESFGYVKWVYVIEEEILP